MMTPDVYESVKKALSHIRINPYIPYKSLPYCEFIDLSKDFKTIVWLFKSLVIWHNDKVRQYFEADSLMQYLPENLLDNKDILKYAFQIDELLIKYVPIEKRSKEICDMVWKYGKTYTLWQLIPKELQSNYEFNTK